MLQLHGKPGARALALCAALGENVPLHALPRVSSRVRLSFAAQATRATDPVCIVDALLHVTAGGVHATRARRECLFRLTHRRRRTQAYTKTVIPFKKKQKPCACLRGFLNVHTTNITRSCEHVLLCMNVAPRRCDPAQLWTLAKRLRGYTCCASGQT